MTIEGRDAIFDENLGATFSEPGSEEMEEREAVLNCVDNLRDIEESTFEEDVLVKTAAFELENYVSSRYLDILSDETMLAEGSMEPDVTQKHTSIPQDANLGVFAVQGEEWTIW